MSQTASDQDLPLIDDFDELVRVVRQHEQLFLRYSKGPAWDGEHGPSHDYEAEIELPGMSVTTIAPEPWWTRPDEDWIARRLCKYEELGEENDRFPWLLTGDIVGYGPDHEPLIGGCRPVARIGSRVLASARQLYGERFNVAEDSRSSSRDNGGE